MTLLLYTKILLYIKEFYRNTIKNLNVAPQQYALTLYTFLPELFFLPTREMKV